MIAILAALAAPLGAAHDVTLGTVPADDGLALRFRIVGNGSETVIVPLAAHLARELAPLATAGRRVVFYDPRGRGASERPARAEGLERDVRDLERLRATLGMGKVALVGWADASLLAARYAIDHPDRVLRLVLVAPMAPRFEPYFAEAATELASRWTLESEERIEALFKAGLERSDPAAFARERALLADPAAFEKLESAPWEHSNEWRENLDRTRAATMRALGAYDWRADLEKCAVPTLVIHGQGDFNSVAGSREWVESRDGRLLVVPRAGRYPFVETREAFFKAMESFLAGGWPDGAELVGEEREHDH